jgi:hypothetical protein
MVGVAQSGPRSGVAGARAPAVRTPGSRSLASRPSSTTTASTRATATSARPSSRRWPTRPTRSGATSPATRGQAPGAAAGNPLRGARQRLSLHRRRRGAGRDHRQSLGRGDRALGAPLAGAPSLALQRPRPPPRLPLRASFRQLSSRIPGCSTARGPAGGGSSKRCATGSRWAGRTASRSCPAAGRCPTPRTLPHRGDQPRRRVRPPGALQALQGRAVVRGRPGAAHRDHGRRHKGLLRRPPRQPGALRGPA